MLARIIKSATARHYLRAAWALPLVAALGCSPKQTPAGDAPPSRESLLALPLANPELLAGREVWLRTCSACHLTGLTGAPIIGDKAAWAPRIAKGLATLQEHAINGFIGPEYAEMPPRGGFADLSDAEVRQAVLFVTHASK